MAASKIATEPNAKTKVDRMAFTTTPQKAQQSAFAKSSA
jgi:hypothetical protein